MFVVCSVKRKYNIQIRTGEILCFWWWQLQW